MRNLIAKRAHCKRHNTAAPWRRRPRMPSCPSAEGAPLKPWGPAGGNGGGGLTTLQCQRTVVRFKHGGGKPGGKEGEIKITPETNSLFGASPNTTRTLTECPISHTNAFLLYAKASRFSFGRQKKQKRQGEFSEFPPAPQNSSYPHKRKAREKRTTAPLSKGAKWNRQQAEKRDGNECSLKGKAEMIN